MNVQLTIFFPMPIISCMDNRRNGLDALSFTLVMIALVLAVLTSVIDDDLIKLVPGALSVALIILALSRMLSTNTARRRYENDRFISFFKNILFRHFHGKFLNTKCITGNMQPIVSNIILILEFA